MAAAKTVKTTLTATEFKEIVAKRKPKADPKKTEESK